MVASAIFKLALKAATPKSFSKMKSDYVPSPVVKETTDVLKALGKTEDDIVKFRQPKSKGGQKLEGSEKEVYKNPDLEEQAIALDEGLITLGEFKEARDILKPRKTYGTVPKLYENFDILGSLPGAKGKEYGIVGVNKNLKSGELVSSRFDIPAYRDYGRYVVTIRKGNELFGYAPTAILKNVKFTGNPNASKFSKIKDPGKKSFNIAKGGGKGPFAVMEGKWQNMSPESTHKYAEDLMDAGKVNKYGETGKEWTEIGFDPASKSSFYNRSTGEPIFAADKVVQVGPMLLARGIKKPTKEQLKSLEFTTKAGKKIKGYKEGGQVMPMQYGGGLSDAYSILSDRRRNQNMYGMGDAPMQQMPSQMSSVFQDPMEASAFSPVNMEQGGDIVVPTIYRQEGGSIPITSVNGLGIPRIVYREEGGGVDDSDSNYGGFGNFGDDFGDLGPGGSSDSFDDSGQDALNEYLGESNITDLGSVRTPQGFEGGDVPNSFNTYVVSPTTSDIRNQAFVDRNQIVRDYINTPYFSGQALANLNQAQQPTAEELDQEDKDLTYDFVNIKDEVDKASGEIGLKNYLGVNPNSRKEGDKAPAFNSVSLNPDGDSNTRALGDSINQAQGFEGRSLVDDGKEGLSTFLGESSLADAFGTPSNPTGPGEGFTESRNKDKLSNELANKSLRGDQRIVYMSVRNKNPNLTPDQVVELIDTIQKNSTIGKKEGGLIGIPKERMINNQPHQLSYINPQEAGLLKALGGSGSRVDGIPAYFMSDDEMDQADFDAGAFTGDTQGRGDAGENYATIDSQGNQTQAADIAADRANQQQFLAKGREIDDNRLINYATQIGRELDTYEDQKNNLFGDKTLKGFRNSVRNSLVNDLINAGVRDPDKVADQMMARSGSGFGDVASGSMTGEGGLSNFFYERGERFKDQLQSRIEELKKDDEVVDKEKGFFSSLKNMINNPLKDKIGKDPQIRDFLASQGVKDFRSFDQFSPTNLAIKGGLSLIPGVGTASTIGTLLSKLTGSEVVGTFSDPVTGKMMSLDTLGNTTFISPDSLTSGAADESGNDQIKEEVIKDPIDKPVVVEEDEKSAMSQLLAKRINNTSTIDPNVKIIMDVYGISQEEAQEFLGKKGVGTGSASEFEGI